METYCRREVFRDGLRRIEIVESRRLQQGTSTARPFAYGALIPMALVITDATGTSGFDMGAQRLTREQLAELLRRAAAGRETTQW